MAISITATTTSKSTTTTRATTTTTTITTATHTTTSRTTTQSSTSTPNPTTSIPGNCTQFTESTCQIDEDTLVDFRHTNSASECQILCRQTDECKWFTWFERQCYLLSMCGDTDQCPGCISGPQFPDVDTCTS